MPLTLLLWTTNSRCTSNRGRDNSTRTRLRTLSCPCAPRVRRARGRASDAPGDALDDSTSRRTRRAHACGARRCWEGVAFFSFVIDVYSRMVVGWQFAGHMRTTLVLDALRMALSTRQRVEEVRLIHHSDRRSIRVR